MSVIVGSQALFKLGDWELHALVKDSEWVEIFHHCKKYEPIEDRVECSYQHPNDTECPGCGETQPDEIQALVALHNMDNKPLQKTLKEMLDDQLAPLIKQTQREIFKQLMSKNT